MASFDGSAFAHLPAAIRAHVPELADGWGDERHSDCAHCPMVATPPDTPRDWAFSPETRCCTAHPNVANFLLGRALERGEPGRSVISARMRDPAGVSARGIFWPAEYERRYRDLIEDGGGYGNEVSMRCPYWVGGEHSCGIWRDRNSMCRSWYCKHEHGKLGGISWQRADALATALELRLADLLIARGAPPSHAPAVEDWIAWFTWCAREVDGLTPQDVAPLVTRDLVELRGELVQLKRTRARRTLPELVRPAITDIALVGDDVLISGYSTFDGLRVPKTLFALLARLDGETPWREALAAARAELRDPPWLDEALVRELYRVGAVRAVGETDS